MNKRIWTIISVLVLASMLFAACTTPTTAPTTEPVAATDVPAVVEQPTVAPTAEPAPAEDFIFGMLLVGPYNDKGYSQAHYEAGLYVEEKLPGSKMIYIDKVNTGDRPGTTPAQLAEDLLSKGAKVIIFNSDDMKDSAVEFATTHPEVIVIHASGDSAWQDGKAAMGLPNLTNIMGRMEYGKMMAGCAAALSSTTGKIGYLGPLINDETRRLTASAYLGAKYCWTTLLQKPAEELQFKVTWIGFWFNIPGVTSDPTQVANDFFDNGFDVVISGIDTTEGLIQAGQKAGEGKAVFAIPYDFRDACKENEAVCLGVPYFNWGPSFLTALTTAKETGTLAPSWSWIGPDWTNINNLDTRGGGGGEGTALSGGAATSLDAFIAELAGGLNLWKGPLNLQDGTEYLKDGETATDFQVWYLPQLLEGMEGQSVSQ